MDLILLSGIVATFAFVAFLSFKPFDPRLTLGAGLLFAAYLGLDDLATILPRLSPLLDPFPSRWNWAGKGYSIALALGVITALGLGRGQVGLTAPGRNVPSSLVAVLLLGFASCLLGFNFQPSAPNLETVAFQALMPGLAEELTYRGVAPALLFALYREKETLEGIPWAVVLLTADGVREGLVFDVVRGAVFLGPGDDRGTHRRRGPLLVVSARQQQNAAVSAPGRPGRCAENFGHSVPGARLVFSCGWHISREGKDRYSGRFGITVKVMGWAGRNFTRRVDFALCMEEALERDELIYEAPAIVGR